MEKEIKNFPFWKIFLEGCAYVVKPLQAKFFASIHITYEWLERNAKNFSSGENLLGRLFICSSETLSGLSFFEVFILHMNDWKEMKRISKFPERLYICIILLWKSLLYWILKWDKVSRMLIYLYFCDNILYWNILVLNLEDADEHCFIMNCSL